VPGVETVLRYFFVFEVLAVVATALAVCRIRPFRGRAVWALVALLGLALVARTVSTARSASEWGCDFALMWTAGDYVLNGTNPYSIRGVEPRNAPFAGFFYPPNALPLCVAFALVPQPLATDIWAAVNVSICLCLGAAARYALGAQDGTTRIEPALAALVASVVVLSPATHFGIQVGQVSLLATLAILGALMVQPCAPRRPLVTAALLAVGSIKAQTLLPFLLLFLRWRDRWTWVFFSAFLAGAALMGAGRPAAFPELLTAMRAAYAEASVPGRVLDPSPLNPASFSVVSFEHTFTRLGRIAPATAKGLSLACVTLVGAALVACGGRWSPGARCAIISLYSMMFFYHRLYDTSVLIVPLLYGAARVRSGSGFPRCLYAGALVAIVAVLNVPLGVLHRLQNAHPEPDLLTALVLPSPFYLILVAFLALAAAAELEYRCSASHGRWLPPESTVGHSEPQSAAG